MAKKILGLDLGVTSIGWALTMEKEEKTEILGMGSRIIPLSVDDKDEFSSGNKISKNQKRTARRTQRKGYDRYQLRRATLTKKLLKSDMFPNEALLKLKQLALWELRAKAANQKIELKELGRVLYHLNQKRGYKSSRSDANLDKKDTEYVAEVKGRFQELKESGLTIGQKFYTELQKNQYYRIKQQVYPREAYIEEFRAICLEQQKHYPQIITNEWVDELENNIIYFQRKLKSQKGLVSICEFEGKWVKTKENKLVFVGPKVMPRSAPLFQLGKIWESINSLTIKNKFNAKLEITKDQKQELLKFLDTNEKLSQAKLFDILGLKKNDGWSANKQIERGIQGNLTKVELLKVLDSTHPLLNFSIQILESDKDTFLVDRDTGEIQETQKVKVISGDIEELPLQKLWHTIYSISDEEECKLALMKRFDLEDTIAEQLARIDFKKGGFGNKSSKAVRKQLPYLMEGYVYSSAASLAGYNHSNSLTKAENEVRPLAEKIKLLEKNSLRQPIVEKILNQMINLVNAIIDKYGKPDEIRIELARELKQSKDERNETFSNLNKREKENEGIKKRLVEDYQVRATRRNVIKWRLFHEINGKESKANATCIYCGKAFGITDALKGDGVDVEHIIPKSLLFDDSQSNKTLSHRICNEAKDNQTAFDYMKSKPKDEFEQYIERVNGLYKDKIIGRAKRDKLLMSASNIPKDFIDRQIRETQYIAKKAKQILEGVCTNVWSTSGGVTEYLRRIWGWDDVLMNLQFDKYKEHGLTEWVEWETNDGLQKKEVIKDWSKRDDHRHHAIDALTIACTKQGFIQRINKLSAKGNRDEMYQEVGEQKKKGVSLLEQYIKMHKPFSTKEVETKAAEILISFKAGKKVATLGTRKVKVSGKKKIVQRNIVVPRGALSEESVYGKIKLLDKKKPIKFLFENPDLIFKAYIRELVKQRIDEHEGNVKKAIKSLSNSPIYLDEENTKELEYATCYREEYVIKYPLDGIKAKDLPYIIDEKIKELIKQRLEQHGNKEKEAFKEPLYFNDELRIPIRSVRMLTGLSSVTSVKKNEKGESIGFVKPGNNHHVGFYLDENGKKVEHGCTFWHAVERKKFGISPIIKNPREVWNKIFQNNESYPQEFLGKLPDDKWTFIESLQQNEMFILEVEKEQLETYIKSEKRQELSNHLYRVQKISINGSGQISIYFRSHMETMLDDSTGAKNMKKFHHVQSIGAYDKLKAIKVKINNLGEIEVG